MWMFREAEYAEREKKKKKDLVIWLGREDYFRDGEEILVDGQFWPIRG